MGCSQFKSKPPAKHCEWLWIGCHLTATHVCYDDRVGKDCSTLSSLNSTGNCVPVSMSDCAPYLSDAKVLYNWKVMLADPNGRLSDWDGGPDICGPTTPWAGIKCNENRTAVTSVNISGFGVIGPLPNSLGQLSFLQVGSRSCILQALWMSWHL